MTLNSKIKIQYDSTAEWGHLYKNEMLPEEHITMEIPSQDLTATQVFKFFRNFMLAIGYSPYSIMNGACSLAFCDEYSIEDMRKVAKENDLTLNEDLQELLEKRMQQELKWKEEANPDWQARYFELQENTQKEILDLKAKLSRALNPDNANYTDAEINAMFAGVKK